MIRVYLPDVKSKDGKAVNYRLDVPVSDDFEPGEPKRDKSLTIDMKIRCSGNKVLVEGILEGSVNKNCSRCLKVFRKDFKTPFSEAFTFLENFAEREGVEALSEEAANNLTITGEYLYLDEYFRQLYILGQEITSLCSPDCKGLCSTCGVNLNLENCRCQGEDSIDQRLLKLKEFNF